MSDVPHPINGTPRRVVVPDTCGYVHVFMYAILYTYMSYSLFTEKWKAHPVGASTVPPKIKEIVREKNISSESFQVKVRS